jgi:hypothetical protein
MLSLLPELERRASCSLDRSGELAEHCQHRDDDDYPQEVVAVHGLQPAGAAGAGRARAVSALAAGRVRAPSSLSPPCWLPAKLMTYCCIGLHELRLTMCAAKSAVLTNTRCNTNHKLLQPYRSFAPHKKPCMSIRLGEITDTCNTTTIQNTTGVAHHTLRSHAPSTRPHCCWSSALLHA